MVNVLALAQDTTNREPPELRLRSYQQEMLEASLQRNIIVAMDTGSGKTHIAIARILAELEHSNPTRLIWFMSPSVALSSQQHRLIEEHLSSYRIITLTGSDNVDKWTEQRLWDAVLENVRVVVGTPAVLVDALTHGFVKMQRLSLLIFDEAHRCVKNSPMNTIMKCFYHPAKARGALVPHILGLTASPVMNAKKASLEAIESNLDAIATTPKLERQTLDQYVHPPTIVTGSYAPSSEFAPPSQSRICDALYLASKYYDFSSDPYVLKLKRQDGEAAEASSRKVEISKKTYCSEELHMLTRRMMTIYEQLGCSAAEWYVTTYIQRCRSSLQQLDLLPDLASLERHHLSTILSKFVASSYNQDSRDMSQTSQKFKQLLSTLEEHASSSRRGIVFVEQRAIVSALSHLLRSHAASYRVGGFVGTSVSKARKTNLVDLSETKQYQQDLDDFRSGAKNLLVATNVLEEGIDVSACNLIVCFDLPKNLVSFVQRRGRARAQDSTYCLLVANNDLQSDPAKWQSLESAMKEAYMSERNEPGAAEEDEDAMKSRVYHIDTTGALLTLENAKAHLYHFCAVSTLQASNYVDLRPEFSPCEAPNLRTWTATVTLPSFVHPDLRTASSSRQWAGETAAVQDAAFEAYVALHKAGLINDNLLPLVKDYVPDAGQHVDQPSLVQVEKRKNSWTLLAQSYFSGKPWYSAEIVITGNGFSVDLELLLPSRVLQADTFALYWNEHITYDVSIGPSSTEPAPISAHESKALGQTTQALLTSVHGVRVPDDRFDFLALLGNTWSCAPDFGGRSSVPATEYLSHASFAVTSCGFIRTSQQAGKAFLLEEVKRHNDTGMAASLVVRGFPKRKDFLHPIPSGQSTNSAYTAKQAFPVTDCTIDAFTSQQAISAALLPSILHRVDVSLAAQELQRTTLQSVGIQSTPLVLEAITSPAAGDQIDYNRLEYLGDAVLKFCTHLQVITQHPTWPEGYLDREKSRIVRNSTLCRAAIDASLDKFIITKTFTGAKWRPPYAGDHRASETPATRQLSSKVLADVVEALIGAAYVDGGLVKAYHCIQVLLPKETWFESHFETLTSGLADCDHTSLDLLEQLIGHRFKHRTLLVEAVTHASLPFSGTGMSYERLEFLGDAVLDLIIVPKLFNYTGRRLKHWQLHSLHETLVNGLFLGHCCMSYSIEEPINYVQERADGKMAIQQSTRTLHLHDFIRASGQLLRDKAAHVGKHTEHKHVIDEALQSDQEYPWSQLLALNPPKFFSDVVESVLGALYIDTHGDLAVCEAFVQRFGILDVMRHLLDEEVAVMSPKEYLGIAADDETVNYAASREKDGSGWECRVKVGGEVVAEVGGCGSRMEAEVRAAREAVLVLQARGDEKVLRKKRKSDNGDVSGGAEANDQASAEDMDIDEE